MVLLCLKEELLKAIQEDDSRRDSLALAAIGSQTRGRSGGGGDMEAPDIRRVSAGIHLGEIYSQDEDGDDAIAGSNPMTAANPLHNTPVSAVVEPGRDDSGGGGGGGGIDVEEERRRETECLREELQRERLAREGWERERKKQRSEMSCSAATTSWPAHQRTQRRQRVFSRAEGEGRRQEQGQRQRQR